MIGCFLAGLFCGILVSGLLHRREERRLQHLLYDATAKKIPARGGCIVEWMAGAEEER